MFRRTFLSLLPAALAADPPHWDEAFPPHKIAGNLYYVGSKGLSSYLVATPRGHILINASFERTAPLIKAAIEGLGFRYSDVKVLLGSHAHGDHMAGNWLVKEQTGARVLVMKEDAAAVRQGEGLLMTRPCVVDQELRDGEVVSWGGESLTAVLTPGHTEGCTTWTMQVDVEGVKRLAVVVGSPNINPGTKLVGNGEYPGIAADFEKAFRVWKSLPCEIFLGAHPEYYGMAEKFARAQTQPGRNVWLDAEGYRAYIAEREKAFQKELARQRRGA